MLTKFRAGLVGGIALLATSTAAPALAAPPDQTRIAYERDGDIYTVLPDGSGLRQLTEGQRYDSEPRWSPDGSRIAFLAGQSLWVMAADGSSERRIVHPESALQQEAWPGSLAWSPNGSHLAVDLSLGKPANTGTLWTVRVSDSKLTQLTKPGTQGREPVRTTPSGDGLSWSAAGGGGSELLYASSECTEPYENCLNQLDLDGLTGTGTRTVEGYGGAGEPVGSASDPDWTADGYLFTEWPGCDEPSCEPHIALPGGSTIPGATNGTYSPTGSEVAYVAGDPSKRHIRVTDFYHDPRDLGPGRNPDWQPRQR